MKNFSPIYRLQIQGQYAECLKECCIYLNRLSHKDRNKEYFNDCFNDLGSEWCVYGDTVHKYFTLINKVVYGYTHRLVLIIKLMDLKD